VFEIERFYHFNAKSRFNAIASISVNLPDPFSPTISVTSGWNSKVDRFEKQEC
jgi:hypothetical protein